MELTLRPALCMLAAATLGLSINGSGAAESGSDGERDLSLVTHNAVVIAAPAERVWPFIVEPGAWKAGARLVPMEGDPHRFNAVMPDDPQTPLYRVSNVEFDAPNRRTIRLNTLDGGLIGFASWELTPITDATRVAYHVYSQQSLPPDQPPIDRAAYLQANRTRFQAELEALRKLVEGAD